MVLLLLLLLLSLFFFSLSLILLFRFLLVVVAVVVRYAVLCAISAEVTYSGKKIIVGGGSLPDQYILDQFHFHWGKTNDVGSEHLLNNKAAPLEVSSFVLSPTVCCYKVHIYNCCKRRFKATEMHRGVDTNFAVAKTGGDVAATKQISQ